MVSPMDIASVAGAIASELSGLSSAERLVTEYAPGTASSFRKRIRKGRKYVKRMGRGRSRGRDMVSRLVPEPSGTTRQVGQPITSSQVIPLRTFTFEPFTWPTAGAGQNQRLGATVKVSGIKICEQFNNALEYPVEVHYAIVQPRGSSTTTTNFFRATDQLLDRSKDFINMAVGVPSSYDFSYNCLPINSDKWIVLTHQKKQLAAENTDVHWSWDTWKFEKYLNLKGQKFTFDVATDTQPAKPLYRIMWWQPLRAEDWAAPYAVLPSITRQADSTIYFRPNFV